MMNCRPFLRDTKGTIIIVVAFVLPVLIMLGGATMDYAFQLSERWRLQHAADAAALAGAKELSLSDNNRQNVDGVVAAIFAANYGGAGGSAKAAAHTMPTVSSRLINAPGNPMQVEVNAEGSLQSLFGSNLGLGNRSINVKAVAIVVGKPNICLLALDPSSQGAIELAHQARVVGRSCAIYSNSTHANGLKAHQSAYLTGSTICSAGGKSGLQGNYQPEPLTDCPQFDDPLANRPEPAVGACTSTNLLVTNQTIDLWPGVYCGGLTIKGTSRVRLQPGIYVVKDGPLLIKDYASIEGVNVGFYLTGPGSNFRFDTGTTVSLTAPKDGEMASLLFFATRTQSDLQNEIYSDNARQLLGTIYLPTGLLNIDANQPIADQSAYTAIVVRRVRALSGPTITLNSDFSITDIPVPDGIRGAGQPVALTR